MNLPFLGLRSLTFWSNGSGLSGSPRSSRNLQQNKNANYQPILHLKHTATNYTHKEKLYCNFIFIINALHFGPGNMQSVDLIFSRNGNFKGPLWGGGRQLISIRPPHANHNQKNTSVLIRALAIRREGRRILGASMLMDRAAGGDLH